MAEIQRASGWWPSLVQVVCDDCGYVGPVHDLNQRLTERTLVQIERDAHECNQDVGPER